MTNIEWTDETWNPTVGCSRVSDGCRHCYAERQAYRNAEMGHERYKGITKKVGGEIRWTGVVRLVPEALEKPLRWKKPRRVFVNSMSDLFHESLGLGDIAAVFGIMATTPQHTYQVLTKRPERMREVVGAIDSEAIRGALLKRTGRMIGGDWGLPLRNVWLGVSVEDQATADERIPLLLQTPAAVRWVSYEPALADVDFSRWLRPQSLAAAWATPPRPIARGLDWIVIGGESGPGARPFDIAWARSTVAQCKAAGVPVFYKQGGSSNRCAHGSKGGHFECFPDDLKIREFPA